MTRIGIVGHRYFRDMQVSEFVTCQIAKILEKTQGGSKNLIALSALAEGSDTIFAEAALAHNIPLEIVRPYKAYSSDFTTEIAQRQYYRLRAAARSETQLLHMSRSNKAYEAAMKWIVRRSNLLIAVWDGHPANGPGGTGHAVQQVIRLNRPWIHINVSNLTTSFQPPLKNELSSESTYAIKA